MSLREDFMIAYTKWQRARFTAKDATTHNTTRGSGNRNGQWTHLSESYFDIHHPRLIPYTEMIREGVTSRKEKRTAMKQLKEMAR